MMTTNVGTTKQIFITVACFVFAATCAVVVWKMKPAETKSETEVHRLHKGDDVNFAMLWAGGESGCISDTAWTELESWAESSLINEFKPDHYQVFRDSSNSGRRLTGQNRISILMTETSGKKMGVNLVPFPRLHFFLTTQAPLFAEDQGDKVKLTVQELTDQMWSSRDRGHRILESVLFDPSSLDDLMLQEISGIAPLIVNVGHGYEDQATGVSFSYLPSHDPDCDTSQIYLAVF